MPGGGARGGARGRVGIVRAQRAAAAPLATLSTPPPSPPALPDAPPGLGPPPVPSANMLEEALAPVREPRARGPRTAPSAPMRRRARPAQAQRPRVSGRNIPPPPPHDPTLPPVPPHAPPAPVAGFHCDHDGDHLGMLDDPGWTTVPTRTRSLPPPAGAPPTHIPVPTFEPTPPLETSNQFNTLLLDMDATAPGVEDNAESVHAELGDTQTREEPPLTDVPGAQGYKSRGGHPIVATQEEEVPLIQDLEIAEIIARNTNDGFGLGDVDNAMKIVHEVQTQRRGRLMRVHWSIKKKYILAIDVILKIATKKAEDYAQLQINPSSTSIDQRAQEKKETYATLTFIWFNLAETLLRSVPRKQRHPKQILNRRLDNILSGQWGDIVQRYTQIPMKNFARKELSPTQKVDRARKLVSSGQVGNAQRLLESNGLAPENDNTVQSIQKLLPQEADQLRDQLGTHAHLCDEVTRDLYPFKEDLSEIEDHPMNNAAALHKYWKSKLSEDKVRAALHSSYRHKSPGPSGFTTDCLKDLLNEDDKRKADSLDVQRKYLKPIKELLHLSTLILAGAIPDKCAEIISANILIAIPKKGKGVRPLGIGETLRRFVGRVSLQATKQELERTLRPFQYCCGTKGGLAAAANLHRLIHEIIPDARLTTAQTDCYNAFPTLNWTMLKRCIDRYAPMYSAMVRLLYREYSRYYRRTSQGTQCFHTSCGTSQGCSLSMHFFSLTLHSILKSIMPEYGSVMAIAIADDNYFTSSEPEVLSKFLTELRRRMGLYAGLQLRPDKFRILTRNTDLPFERLFPDIQRSQVQHDGLVIAGTPCGIGPRAIEYESQACMSILRSTQTPDENEDPTQNIFNETLAKGRTLQSAIAASELLGGSWQARHLLLRLTISPMCLHLLSSCSPEATVSMCKGATKLIDKAWLALLELQGDEDICKETVLPQSRLRIGRSGDGFTDFLSIAQAAFLGSFGLWLSELKDRYKEASEASLISPIWEDRLTRIFELWENAGPPLHPGQTGLGGDAGWPQQPQPSSPPAAGSNGGAREQLENRFQTGTHPATAAEQPPCLTEPAIEPATHLPGVRDGVAVQTHPIYTPTIEGGEGSAREQLEICTETGTNPMPTAEQPPHPTGPLIELATHDLSPGCSWVETHPAQEPAHHPTLDTCPRTTTDNDDQDEELRHDLRHDLPDDQLHPRACEGVSSERTLDPSPQPISRTFESVKNCYEYLRPLDDGWNWPMPAYHEEILAGLDEPHSPGEIAFHDGLRTMLHEPMPRLQKYFSRKINERACNTLIASVAGRPASYILPTGETKDQALTRLRDMAASPFMGLYLKDLPQPGSSLSWDQGVAYARYRYGIPQLNVADPMQPNRLKLCSCSTEDVQHSLDLSGRHQVLCPKGPWSTTSRHAHTTNAVARSLSGRVRHYRR